MYETTAAALVLDRQRAADLDRDVEMLRRQAERPAHVIARPAALTTVTSWLFGRRRSAAAPRVAVAH